MILCVDCGSTYLKAALLDVDLTRLQEASVALTYDVLDAGRAELDPEALWGAFVTAVRSLPGARHARTLSVTSQAQTFGVVDAGGRAVRPFLSWMDKRADLEAGEIRRRLGGVFHQHCGFPVPLPQLQVSKVLWTRHHTTALTGGSCVVALPEYLALRLGGARIVDRNLAGMGGLCSLREAGWWSEALAMVELEPRQLGDLVEIGTRRPLSVPRSIDFLPPRLDLVCAGNDQTAGAYGELGAEGGTLLTLGTALVVYRTAGQRPGPFHAAGCWGPYPGGGYYELATRDEGCRALDWAAVYLDPGRPLAELLHAAAAARPCAVRFHPQRMGDAGAWVDGGDVGERCRAVLEGIAFSARELLGSGLGTDPGADGGPIRVAGGGSSSDLWMQILADTLGRPCRRAYGDPLLGAARLAAGCVPAGAVVGRVFAPDPAAVAVYDRGYRCWLEAAGG